MARPVATPAKKRAINASLGKMVVGDNSTDLTIYGLGSAFGLVIWAPSIQLAVLSHIIQPSSKGAAVNPATPAKFADWAIPQAIETLLSQGAQKDELVAKLAGGAHPLAAALGNAVKQNSEQVTALLESEGIELVATSLGGSVGRTIVFHPDSGFMDIKMVNGVQEQI
jgi:chemotaxis protein CheD